jgi:hypothetical protein
MQLHEFLQDQKALLDEFEYQYLERKKRGKEQTVFRPEDQWIELLEDFLTHRRSMLLENEDETQVSQAAA